MVMLQRWSKFYYNRLWIIQIQGKMTGRAPADGNRKDVEGAMPLK